jgi:ketosteroid isomerase-like protein
VSQENVEIVRQAVAALNRGEVEGVARLIADDFVLIAGRSAIEGPLVGRDGLREFFADNAANFDLFQHRIDEVLELDDHRVLACGTTHIRGRGGEVETDIPVACIVTVRGGKLIRWEDFRERRRALKAVGLEA